ncbi:hypothetical protein DVA76_19380, partial [Acinetobacter baumannii]
GALGSCAQLTSNLDNFNWFKKCKTPNLNPVLRVTAGSLQTFPLRWQNMKAVLKSGIATL